MPGLPSARTARRIATAAAYGSGGVGAAGAGLYGLMVLEAKLARRAIGTPTGEPLQADGRYGGHEGGDGGDGHTQPLRLVVLGDSTAAGLGVDTPDETPGALLAAGLAEIAARPVDLTNLAVVGAETRHLAAQVERALPLEPHAALIMIGANDVTHKVRPSVSVRLLDEAVRRLRENGCEVVVGTCPDLGTVEPIPHPLRWVARRWSRQLAAAQTVMVVEAGGRTVSLGSILGKEFAAYPGDMFSADRFHPSAAGYAAAAAAMLPSIASALGLWGPEEEQPEALRGDSVLPVAMAAVEAAAESGTEVAAARVGGRDRGPRGRWAQLRHRRRRPLPDVVREAVGGGGSVGATSR
ncbi:MAG TPA: SGNH/GDSL hydrolase family protein [Jiangellales bacterium]|nr:SGNH/GDSL hydrolase family protein [Jiangellales bacterium]